MTDTITPSLPTQAPSQPLSIPAQDGGDISAPTPGVYQPTDDDGTVGPAVEAPDIERSAGIVPDELNK